jgi:hypothetical protein
MLQVFFNLPFTLLAFDTRRYSEQFFFTPSLSFTFFVLFVSFSFQSVLQSKQNCIKVIALNHNVINENKKLHSVSRHFFFIIKFLYGDELTYFYFVWLFFHLIHIHLFLSNRMQCSYHFYVSDISHAEWGTLSSSRAMKFPSFEDSKTQSTIFFSRKLQKKRRELIVK